MPTPKQAIFLTRPEREGLFGGAAGGGKTVALLAFLLQYVDVPGYHGLGLRRTYSDLSLPGGLMDLAHQWLDGTDARWNDKAKTWRFPSGATITFGYCQHPGDEMRYKGPEFQAIAWDELTEFLKEQYEFLMTRLRRPKDVPVPLRVRCGSNPGGVGHAWVKEHFIQGREPDCIFIPSLYLDNPHLDYDEYTASMVRINPILREQMLRGNWDIQAEGKLLKREWFPLGGFPRLCRRVRYWDMAATDEDARPKKRRTDPDYTVGVLMGEAGGRYGILDVQRFRRSPGDVETLIAQVAAMDGPGTVIGMEQEGGSSGKAVIDRYRRDVLRGYAFYGLPSTGSKVVRAVPLASAAQHGDVVLAPIYEDRAWLGEYLEEIALFPHSVHDDQVDATSGAFLMLSPGQGREAIGADEMAGARQVIPSLGGFDRAEIPGL